MTPLDVIDLDEIHDRFYLTKKKFWAMGKSGRGLGLKVMIKSKLKKINKKNENYWIWWFLIFFTVSAIFF